jgi:hypothetical protein
MIVKRKCCAKEKRDGNCHVFANSRWAIQSPLLLAGLFPTVFLYFLRIAQRLSNNHWEFPSGFLTLF